MIPPMHVAALVNPTAGKGRGRRLAPIAIEALGDNNVHVDVVQGRNRDEALEILDSKVKGGVDAVVAIGGDGTVSLALQCLAGTQTPLGVVALGTGDDVARQHGLARRDPLAAVAAIVAGRTTPVDVAKVTHGAGTTWFLTALASGFDSEVNEVANRMSWPRGDARYVAAMLRLLPRFSATDYVITVDGMSLSRRAMLVAVGNGPSYGGGMLVCPDARTDDDQLAITVVNEVSRRQFLRLFPKVYRGAHTDHPAVEVFTGREIELQSHGRSAWADGERISDLPVSITSLQAGVHLLT